jgi:hypothetical protein
MKLHHDLPTKWRNFLNLLAYLPVRFPDRLVYKIIRRNKRMIKCEAKGAMW